MYNYIYLCTNNEKNHKINDSNFANSHIVACNVDQFHTKLEEALYMCEQALFC